jgi:hypothetical protein
LGIRRHGDDRESRNLNCQLEFAIPAPAEKDCVSARGPGVATAVPSRLSPLDPKGEMRAEPDLERGLMEGEIVKSQAHGHNRLTFE